MKLFDDGGNDSDISKIEINQEFARRYEHNKKREDLQRLEELKKNGVIDSDIGSEDESSDDEEDIVNHSSKQELKFFDALIKVRNKDPSLKDNDAKLFDSDNSDDDDDNKKEKKKKSLYLKDVNAKQLLEKGPEFEDEDDEEEIKNKSKKKTYAEEQEALRKEFLDAVGDEKEDDGDGFLKVKSVKNDEDDDGDEYEKKLNEYFQDEKLDDNEKFLKEYFRNKLWLDRDNGHTKYLDDKIDISDDEKELERQEEYEQVYNFRHEENAGDRVVGHSRIIENSVRKKDNARKLQRKNKEDRMKHAEFERNEELKHLKNLKKKEMNEKLRKIRETAGIAENETCLLDERDLEEEFDPEEHDRKMSKAFDDKFYEAEDVDPGFGSAEEDGELEKPSFDDEDELLGLPKGWDGSGDGFLATREKTLKSKVNNGEEGKKKKRKLEEEVIKKELEEYYKLDYEDTIGELKTRFKYRPVNKNNYGLKTRDIIAADAKELNQLIPLKKLATYREEEFVAPRNKIKEQKQKIRSLLKGESSSDGHKKKLKEVAAEKPKPEEDNKELSRKQRRKKRLNELKLPTNRLIAYNKIQPKSDKKRKHKA